MKKRILTPEVFWEWVGEHWLRYPYVPPNMPPYPQEFIDATPESERVPFVREGGDWHSEVDPKPS